MSELPDLPYVRKGSLPVSAVSNLPNVSTVPSSGLVLMRIAVVGSRSLYGTVHYGIIDGYLKSHPCWPGIIVISGGARGIDKLAEIVAKDLGLPFELFRAEWDTYGKSAGHKRNELMAEFCDAALVIWDGESKGTKNMISHLMRLGKPTEIVTCRHQ